MVDSFDGLLRCVDVVVIELTGRLEMGGQVQS